MDYQHNSRHYRYFVAVLTAVAVAVAVPVLADSGFDWDGNDGSCIWAQWCSCSYGACSVSLNNATEGDPWNTTSSTWTDDGCTSASITACNANYPSSIAVTINSASVGTCDSASSFSLIAGTNVVTLTNTSPTQLNGFSQFAITCNDVVPTPSPTPIPVPLVYTNTITLPPDERTNTLFEIGCDQVSVDGCTSTGSDTTLYANGLRLGGCDGVTIYDTFLTRYPLSNTLTLINGDSVTHTASISMSCEIVVGAQSWTLPATPTLPPFPTPEETTVTFGIQSDGGIPMPDFYNTYQTWLDHARSTVDLVNQGNFLFIFGGMGMAGLVLAWAIDQVKNPRSW